MPLATGTVLQLPNPPCPQGWYHNSLQSFSWVFSTAGSHQELQAGMGMSC